ncbi:MAG: PIN domain-containing protein [Actinomycetota bacterium]|nr:PIN domain-containing protein [Actinomycetota bacterium]
MAVVLDTSVVVAFMVEDEPDHEAVTTWIEALDDDLVTTPLALAEMDHVMLKRAGRFAVVRLWQDFDTGAYQVRWWADALRETLKIARVEGHLGIGLADASLVALAERLGTLHIATLDHRHFRRLAARDGEPFVVLPADAS